MLLYVSILYTQIPTSKKPRIMSDQSAKAAQDEIIVLLAKNKALLYPIRFSNPRREAIQGTSSGSQTKREKMWKKKESKKEKN